MQNLLYFLFKYGYVLIFLSLEVLCLNLVVRFNDHQNQIFLKSSNYVSGWVLERYHSVTQYFGLTRVAADLAAENAELLNKRINHTNHTRTEMITNRDTVHNQQFELVAARVINNSITSLDNHLTIDKGLEDGIEKGMGIITMDGVVGIITDANRHFASALSLLNRHCRISASIERNHFFGSLYWEGGDPRLARMGYIPKHADLKMGDRIVTSGYGAIFPKGLPIGEIVDFNLSDGSNFYEIDVKLSIDLSQLNYVYVVRNLLKGDQLGIQSDNIDESDIQ